MRLALIGAGLIGSSAAWAMKRAGVFDAVTVCDRSAVSGRKALDIGFADRSVDSVEAAITDADAVMVAVPVRVMPDIFARIATTGCAPLITDVGSTRSSVITAARSTLSMLQLSGYCPVHPIAGGEMPGIDYASADLFIEHKAISTPLPESSQDAVDFWEGAWRSAGAIVSRMDAIEHDEMFAYVSHLPHLLAYAIVETISRMDDAQDKFRMTGAGFRDFSRIAASSPEMWRDICLTNRDALLGAIENYRAALSTLTEAVRQGDIATLDDIFTRAANARRELGTRKKNVIEKNA